MPVTNIPSDEEDILRRILAHHKIPVTDTLISHLAQLIAWVHQVEQDKVALDRHRKAPLPLVLMSQLGILSEVTDDESA